MRRLISKVIMTRQNFRGFGSWSRALQQWKEWRRKKMRGLDLHHLSRTSPGLRPHCCRSLDSCYTLARGGCRHWCCFLCRGSSLGWCRPDTHSRGHCRSQCSCVDSSNRCYFLSRILVGGTACTDKCHCKGLWKHLQSRRSYCIWLDTFLQCMSHSLRRPCLRNPHRLLGCLACWPEYEKWTFK